MKKNSKTKGKIELLRGPYIITGLNGEYYEIDDIVDFYYSVGRKIFSAYFRVPYTTNYGSLGIVYSESNFVGLHDEHDQSPYEPSVIGRDVYGTKAQKIIQHIIDRNIDPDEFEYYPNVYYRVKHKTLGELHSMDIRLVSMLLHNDYEGINIYKKGVNRTNKSSCCGHMRYFATYQEAKWAEAHQNLYGNNIVRGKRNSRNLPDSRDDFWSKGSRSWKQQSKKRKQWMR